MLPPADVKRGSPVWASQETCERLLGLTDWNRVSIIDDIIEPAETRKYLAGALEALHTKRELRPPKKHGLIPL